MNIVICLGLLAGFCTSLAFIPQVVQIYHSKSTEGISLLMYFIYSIGLVLWILYGVLIGSEAVMISNAITLLAAIAIILMKLRWK